MCDKSYSPSFHNNLPVTYCMYMAAPGIRDKIANKIDKAPILVELIVW